MDRGQLRSPDGDALGSFPHTLGDETDAANGRLAAAAPDLLAERDRLKAALEKIDGLHAMCGTKRAHKIAREALAGEAVPS